MLGLVVAMLFIYLIKVLPLHFKFNIDKNAFQ